jgi:hypothetical protein
VQWQWYTDIGAEVGVWNEMSLHWHRMFIASDLRAVCAFVEYEVAAADVEVFAMAGRRVVRFACGVILTHPNFLTGCGPPGRRRAAERRTDLIMII